MMINRLHSNGMQFPMNRHKRVQTLKTVIEARAGDDKRVQTGNSPTNLAKLVPALLTDSAGGIGILTTVLAVRGFQTVGGAVTRLTTAAVNRFNRTPDDNNDMTTPTPINTNNTTLQSDTTSLILADTAPILDTVTPKLLTPQVVDNKEEKEEEEEEEFDKEEEPLLLLPLTTPAEPNKKGTITIEREQDVITNITTTTTPFSFVDRSHIAYLSAPSSPKQVEEEERKEQEAEEEEEVVAPSSASLLSSSPSSPASPSSPSSPTLNTIPANATKGGRHISMLSSPMSFTPNIWSNNNNKGSSSSSAGGKVDATSSGDTGESPASSFASRLPALNAAKGGGSGGGDGNGGGGGGKNDGGDDGNNNNNRKMGILLVALLVVIGSTMVVVNNSSNNKKADATVTKKKK